MGYISIHTLRMEGDPVNKNTSLIKHKFQSTPSAWRVTTVAQGWAIMNPFQSTPSAWRVTWRPSLSCGRRQHFNPHPPHGG